jgi:hypothetical protein
VAASDDVMAAQRLTDLQQAAGPCGPARRPYQPAVPGGPLNGPSMSAVIQPP